MRVFMKCLVMLSFAMTVTAIFMFIMTTTGCSSLPVRTRSTDPVLRVAIDSDSIAPGSYARLVHALMKSGKFIVVDRSAGFRAVVHEQELQHTTNRFAANEKYSQWSQLYGVGGIIVGTQQCEQKVTFLVHDIYYACIQNLVLIDSTTGEIIASSENAVEQEENLASKWDDSVEQLVIHYPKRFMDREDLHRTITYSDTLNDYRKQVPAHSKPDTTLRKDDEIR